MVKRTFPVSLAVVMMAASAALAAGLTDSLQAERMTVVKVDHAAGRFQCAEHRRWTAVLKADLREVQPGISSGSSPRRASQRTSSSSELLPTRSPAPSSSARPTPRTSIPLLSREGGGIRFTGTPNGSSGRERNTPRVTLDVPDRAGPRTTTGGAPA